MELFKILNEVEIDEYRQWARENYKPFAPIKGVWHPVIQVECVLMNIEAGEYDTTNNPIIFHMQANG